MNILEKYQIHVIDIIVYIFWVICFVLLTLNTENILHKHAIGSILILLWWVICRRLEILFETSFEKINEISTFLSFLLFAIGDVFIIIVVVLL